VPALSDAAAPGGTRYAWADRFDELPSGCLTSLLVVVVVWVPLILLALLVVLNVRL